MGREKRIFIAGNDGIAGINLLKHFEQYEYEIFSASSSELAEMDQIQVKNLFTKMKPDYIFITSGIEGGILANINRPADLIYKNLKLQINLIDSARYIKPTMLFFVGSSCIYPKYSPQPIKEEYLLDGPIEPTNEAYAIAKISGIKMCQAYNKQHGTKFISIIPANIYGPHDNFDINTSHVIPALINKFHKAKINNEDSVIVWGSGEPKREFLYADDFVDACIFLMKKFENSNICGSEIINIGVGEDITIKDLAVLVKDIVGFEGQLIFDRSKPDGMPKKLLDNSKIVNMGWRPKTKLAEGIKRTYRWYLKHEKA